MLCFRIIFTDSILRLRHNDKKREITIQVPRKKYHLRAASVEVMMEWFVLFQTAMNQQMTLNAYSQHSTVHLMDFPTVSSMDDVGNGNESQYRMSEKPLPIGIPQDETIEPYGMMPSGGMTMHQHRKNNTESNHSALDLKELQQNQTVTFDDHSRTHSLKIPTFEQRPATQGQAYEFAHGILRDSIYEQMLSTQRIRIHKSVQEHLRFVLNALSRFPDDFSKEEATRQYTRLRQRHGAIEEFYSDQQRNLGNAVAEIGHKKKRRKTKFPNFIGLD